MNEPVNQEDKECIYKYWAHDKEDIDQDADLIGFLGGKVNKKKKKSRLSKSKTRTEQPQQEETAQNVGNEEPKRDTSANKFTKIMTELNLNSYRREIPSPLKLKQKSQPPVEETLPNHLIQLNQQTIEPATVSPLKVHHLPSSSLQMGNQLNYYKYRPSFNAGAPFQDQQSVGGSVELNNNNNIVKLSDFIARKSTKLHTAFPHPPLNNGEHHPNIPNNLMLPLKQYADQDTLDEYDVETTKYSSNKSIYPTLSKVKTPHQGSSIVPTNWGEVNLGNGRTSPLKEFQERAGRNYDNSNNILVSDNSPMRRSHGRQQSLSVLQPIPVDQKGQIMPIPLLQQYNLPSATSLNDGSRRSLVKLPTINTTKGISMDNSPGKGSPLIFDKTPIGGAGRQLNREPRDNSGSPFLVERKLSRFMSNGHIRNDLSVFKAAAARQLQEFA